MAFLKSTIFGLCAFVDLSQLGVMSASFAETSQNLPAMTLQSSAFNNAEWVPQQYTCKGANKIPPLQINNVPANTRSLALTLDDPDAILGTWHHWVVWNIPADTQMLADDTIPPDTVVGKNSYHHQRYEGPCPPLGTHRYYFHLYSLDKTLDLNANSNFEDLNNAMNGHIIARASLMGRYKK